jgi:hypothetical protein
MATLNANGVYAELSLTVGALQCEYRSDRPATYPDGRIPPMGIDAPKPRLSWQLRSDERGQRQTAYRVLVASSPAILAHDRGDLWDSGTVVSSRSIQVAYSGKPLVSEQWCYWKVRIWDHEGKPSEWSWPNAWEMGLLRPEDWKAHWITAARPTKEGDPLPIFRRSFVVAKPVRRATLFVCGLGQYEMRINGHPVTFNLMEPGWTDYRKTCLYNAYDVRNELHPGRDVLGAVLGNGMYHVTGPRYTKFTGSFGPPKLIAQLHIEYADGSSQLIKTDETWQTTPGPITFSSIYGGEDYDARHEQPGWDKPEFDAASWQPATPCEGPGGRLVGSSQSAPPICWRKTLKPVQWRQIRPGVWLYDLGQNCSLIPTIKVHGPAGAQVTIRTGERFVGDKFASGSSDMASYHYVLKGGEPESWSPRFTYVGARYLLVEGAIPEGEPAQAELPVIDSIEAGFVCSTSRQVGRFACSNELFNRTNTLIRWAMQSNMMSLLTDCPHRERLGWLEQDHLMGPSLIYNYDIPALLTKICGDMADAQLTDGLVPDIAPEYVVFDGGFRDSPEWGSACVLIPWQLYQWYGDTAILRAQYDTMQRYVAYLGTKAQHNIVSHGLADWYALQGTSAGQTATAFYFTDIDILAHTARLLGKTSDAARYAALAAEVRAAYNAQFYDPQTRQYAGGSQTANAMPVAMGIVEPQNAAAVVEAIVADIRKRGDALTAGDVGYRYVLRALAAGGRSDVIFAMNSRSDKPGYGMMLARGATSLPEAWDANPDSSLNHFMLGHIMEWFYADLAGIQFDPAMPAFKSILIKPQPVGDVTWVRAKYESAYGDISSNWRRDNGKFTLSISIPANTTATVYMPARAATQVMESGRPVAQAKGVKLLQQRNGVALFAVGAGTYRFTAELPAHP